MSDNKFSSEVELGKFLHSIDIIPFAFRAISETSSDYKFHTSPSGIQVLAFNCSSDYTERFINGEFDLVSSEVVDFISKAEVNSSFSINKAAVEFFNQLPDELKQFDKKLINSPLVITGWGLGGYRAILFALWLHHAIDEEESKDSWVCKRPICITFGSPLVGDENLQLIISKYPQWKSCFLNVVAKTDLVASFFSSNSRYKPFGTFLFCTETGGHTAFEDQESILAVLDAMRSSNAGNFGMYNYGNDLKSMRRKVLYRGVSESGEFNLDSLREGIRLQFREVGVLDGIPNDQIVRLQGKQLDMIKSKTSVYEPTKKLNDLKIKMSHIEKYMKMKRAYGGYYDCYKNRNKSREEIAEWNKIVTYQRTLNQYWMWFVEETDRKPQKEDAKMRKRWLLNGHNYRRMVEPLDIAEFYGKAGNRNYIEKRSDHYIKLEKLLNNFAKPKPNEGKKDKAASLTNDSCFWAHVEEALILLKDLKDEAGSSNKAIEIKQKLEQFEKYVMSAINEYSVSPDIFLKGSSLMKWWCEYKTKKGSSYTSEFAQYMNNQSYKSYQ